MNRTLKVLVVIAIVISAVEICALAVALLEPLEGNISASFAAQAELRWKVYWFSGLGAVVLGLVVRRRYSLTGDALCIAGTYLMLLGNNGGIFSRGHEAYRIGTSVLTLGFLLIVALLGERSSKPEADA